MAGGGPAEYHDKDFEWEDLRQEVEQDVSMACHVAPPCSIGGCDDDVLLLSEAWRSFHRRHSTGRFFKGFSPIRLGFSESQERRYLLKEFPELEARERPCCVLEVGCGNGSTVLPVLRAGERTIVYACDCSPDALEAAKAMVESADDIPAKERFRPFLLDFTSLGFPKWLLCDSCRVSRSSDHEEQCCLGGVDLVTLVFTLSAVPFQKMPFTLAACFSVLKPGGLLLFRDYGLYDMSMLRFPPEQRVGFREYRRSDGTLSYFFSLDLARDLFCNAGFIVMELDYCCVRMVNRRSGTAMHRVWVHGKFLKPLSSR